MPSSTSARTLLCAQQAWEGMLRTASAPADLCLWHTFLGAVYEGVLLLPSTIKRADLLQGDGSLSFGIFSDFVEAVLFLFLDYFIHNTVGDSFVCGHEIIAVGISLDDFQITTRVFFQK